MAFDPRSAARGAVAVHALRRRYGRAFVRYPIVRVVIIAVGVGKRKAYVMRAYDDQGHLRSGVTAPSDLAYCERMAAEWFPGVPVEHKES